MSIKEVCDYINAKKEVESERTKFDLLKIEIEVDLLSQRIAKLLGDKSVNISRVTDLFPDLFQKEIRMSEESKINTDLIKNRENMRLFAQRHNKRREK